MSVLAVLQYPDPRLRRRAEAVCAFDASLERLIDDMFETLYAAPALGLAASQVGVPTQVITIDVSGTGIAPEVYVNPQIIARSGFCMVEESCLSVPGISGLVRRPAALRVRALDRHGRAFSRELEGMPAVCLAHEMDHLAGRLFIDSLSLWQRLRLRGHLAGGAARRPVSSGLAGASAPGSGAMARRG